MTKVAFLHPDLGIGGAERLVVDAALELRKRGHNVTIFTTHYDPDRCFEDIRKEHLDIKVVDSVIPNDVKSHFRAPCSIARTAFAAMVMGMHASFDVVFCDLVPHIIPLVRRMAKSKVIYYCHYPDKLLTPERARWYRFYRAPIDRLEEFGLRSADLILVNSSFTESVFRETFPRLCRSAVSVLYPGVDPAEFQSSETDGKTDLREESIILSLNRYAKDKNLGLALDAMGSLREKIPYETFRGLTLVFAGGFDGRLSECRQAVRSLEEKTREMHLWDHVRFLFSISDDERRNLLKECLCLVYTSCNEHFGIGIIEAMAGGKPVIAVNRGGPKEIVRDGVTGFLCDPEPEPFGDALAQLVEHPDKRKRMGVEGEKRVASSFSRHRFGERLDCIVRTLVGGSETC
ncbi:MAG: glycosyltransferase [Deltaproteobacteria bacterium]|nr:glycosyltransferase [Deltaproteobacteria bacterium]